MQQDAFEQAEQRFRWYTDEWQSGRLALESYRSAINELRVTDDRGHLWMLQEGSGQWHVWTGGSWVASSPKKLFPSQPPPPPFAPRSRAVETPRAPVDAGARGGGVFGKVLRVWLITLVIFAVIGGALLIFVADFPPEGLAGVGLAALISLVISTKSLMQSWEGRVVQVYNKRVRMHGNEGEPGTYRDILYARIQQPSGKMREVEAMPDWQEGMYLRKRKGEAEVEKVT